MSKIIVIEGPQEGHPQGVPDPTIFKECLQPHIIHCHGRVRQFDYAFESHNITFNVECAFTGTAVNSVYKRWPELLSVVSTQRRQSAYLVWGEKTVKQTQAVSGLGKNLESDETVSRICSIKLQGYKGDIECQFCRGPDPLGYLSMMRHNSATGMQRNMSRLTRDTYKKPSARGPNHRKV